MRLLDMAKDSNVKDRELKKRIDPDHYMSCAVLWEIQAIVGLNMMGCFPSTLNQRATTSVICI
ncbi:hypothetical protein PIB30_006269 [Stylosanthes scabra]|uniref:Callose synthase helical domain-containing protein n=1 Tax=Stylosanthes scabra TaxID=79078 RepID=A0ABU6Q490_9FABA|nr:hypothetical protein [Stylosanthes scabra]